MSQGTYYVLSTILSVAVHHQAETLWIQDVQSVMIQENAFDNLKKQLDLFQDSNRLWRCGGRLELAEIDYGAKHPILLPRNHHFTHLVVLDAHERVMHNGPKETLAELRQKYWIIRGRSLVRYIIHRCVVCRRYDLQGTTITTTPNISGKRRSSIYVCWSGFCWTCKLEN